MTAIVEAMVDIDIAERSYAVLAARGFTLSDFLNRVLKSVIEDKDNIPDTSETVSWVEKKVDAALNNSWTMNPEPISTSAHGGNAKAAMHDFESRN